MPDFPLSLPTLPSLPLVNALYHFFSVNVAVFTLLSNIILWFQFEETLLVTEFMMGTSPQQTKFYVRSYTVVLVLRALSQYCLSAELLKWLQISYTLIFFFNVLLNCRNMYQCSSASV